MTPELLKLWRSAFPNTLIPFIWPARMKKSVWRLPGSRADALVLDLETSGPGEVEHLHHEFPGLCIVGTHRLADDEIWTEAVNRGASDICEPRQKDVVRSVLHSVSHGLTRHAAA